MAFPATVRTDIASGFPGDLALDGPTYATPVVLAAGADADNLVIGRVVSIDRTSQDPQVAIPGRPANTYITPGILVSRGQQASYGTAAGGSLANTLTLPVGAVAEVLHGCAGVFVTMLTPANTRPGNLVIFDTDTGELDSLVDGGTLPSGFEVLGGAVVIRDRSAPTPSGLTIISLTGPLPIGAPGGT